MSSKTKSKDRTRKKRDGTPDKSATPSQEESTTPTKNVIWNEEIEKLQIKTEELPKLWLPRPPSKEKSYVRVAVQKKKKVSEEDKPKSKIVCIAKPAPLDVPVQPVDYSGCAGPRYNEAGEVIPYSLLGTYEDFHKEASRRGDLPLGMPVPQGDLAESEAPTVKYEKKKRLRSLDNSETNALRNWYYKMVERKKQQGYISKLLQRAPKDLAMNQSDNNRAIQEQRYLIDRTIPKVDYGKGYRVGSEFWYQQEQFGDELLGLHMTLSQTQRGYPPPIEHVGLSQTVKEEKGCEWIGKCNVHVNYHWHKSEYLDQRLKQLQPYINEIDPWRPEFDNLQIKGSNKPRVKALDVEKDDNAEVNINPNSFVEEDEVLSDSGSLTDAASDNSKEKFQNDSTVSKNEPVFGPSLLFGGQAARWAGGSVSSKDEVSIEAIVNFEAFTADRITSYLELTNDGTTPIYFDWKKITKEKPFGLVHDAMQRFYFNNSSDVILPGDTVKFPFVFKSSNAGVFTEQWEFETRPVLCGGAALVVTLRGVALQRDKFKFQREELEKVLLQKQAKQVVSHLLDELLSGIRTPEPPRSPIDAYITEEEIFMRNNPELKYNHELVTQLKDIYGQLFDANVRAENVWSLSIEDLEESILQLDDDEEEKREMLLHQMNSLIGKLTYLPHVPVEQDFKLFGYQIFVETVDRIVAQSILLRHLMGLSDREQQNGSVKESGDRKGQKVTEGRNRFEVTKEKSKGSAKEVKTTKPLPGKSDLKGKVTPALTSRKASPLKSTASTPMLPSTPGDKAGEESVGSGFSSPETSGIVLNEAELATAEKLYRETFTLQVYDLLGDMADKMEYIFSSLKDNTRSDFAYRNS